MKNKFFVRIKQVFEALDTRVRKHKSSEKKQKISTEDGEENNTYKPEKKQKISTDDGEQKHTYKPVKRKWPLSWIPPVHLRHPDWSYCDENQAKNT